MKSVEEGLSSISIIPAPLKDNTEELINAAIAAGTLNPLNEDGTEKTRNQLKNELKKAAKLEKFNAKQSKVNTAAAPLLLVNEDSLDKKSQIDEAFSRFLLVRRNQWMAPWLIVFT